MAVTPRDAATVMLLRDALDDRGQPAVEVCLLRRNLGSGFMPGAYVFPGGSVDPGDRGEDARRVCRGLTDAEASAILGVGSGGLAFWVAALRECFEEAGVMLAQPRDDQGPGHRRLLDSSDPETVRRFADYRDAVNDGSMRLSEVCAREDLVLAAETVHYVAHWITPEESPRRFDTRFFVAAAPPGQLARHDGGEAIATIWARPGDALARAETGDIELRPPTIASLRSIESFRSVGEALTWAAELTEVVTMLPIMVIENGHRVVVHPGDDGYEQALADRRTDGPDDSGLIDSRADR